MIRVTEHEDPEEAFVLYVEDATKTQLTTGMIVDETKVEKTEVGYRFTTTYKYPDHE